MFCAHSPVTDVGSDESPQAHSGVGAKSSGLGRSMLSGRGDLGSAGTSGVGFSLCSEVK